MSNPDYYWPQLDEHGNVIGRGQPMTEDEIAALNPTEGRLRQLTDAVDQLILDSLGTP